MKYPIIRPPSIMQFKVVFHNDQVILYNTKINIFFPYYYHTIYNYSVFQNLRPDFYRNIVILPSTMCTKLPRIHSVEIQWSNLPNTTPTTPRQIFFSRWTHRLQSRFRDLRVHRHQLFCLRS